MHEQFNDCRVSFFKKIEKCKTFKLSLHLCTRSMNVRPVKGMVFSSLRTLSKRRPKPTRWARKSKARLKRRRQLEISCIIPEIRRANRGSLDLKTKSLLVQHSSALQPSCKGKNPSDYSSLTSTSPYSQRKTSANSYTTELQL